MIESRSIIIRSQTIRDIARSAVGNLPIDEEHPFEVMIRLYKETRTLEQNAYQFPYLEGFAKQLKWPVNGEMVWMDKLEWKDILTCAFEEEIKPRLAMGFEGAGVVMLGRRTSKYGKSKFALWMTWLMAAADLKGVTPIFKDGEHKRWDGRVHG